MIKKYIEENAAIQQEAKRFSRYETKVVYIQPPVPESIKYYELTNYKEIDKLYKQNPHMWNRYKALGKIPYNIIQQVEGE